MLFHFHFFHGFADITLFSMPITPDYARHHAMPAAMRCLRRLLLDYHCAITRRYAAHAAERLPRSAPNSHAAAARYDAYAEPMRARARYYMSRAAPGDVARAAAFVCLLRIYGARAA